PVVGIRVAAGNRRGPANPAARPLSRRLSAGRLLGRRLCWAVLDCADEAAELYRALLSRTRLARRRLCRSLEPPIGCGGRPLAAGSVRLPIARRNRGRHRGAYSRKDVLAR